MVNSNQTGGMALIMRNSFGSVWLAVLLAAMAGCGRSETPVPAATPPVLPAEGLPDLFADGTVPRIEIEIPRSGMSTLRRTHWGRGEDRPEVRATVREAGIVYQDVAVHLKGAAGSFRTVDDRPGLTLKFDKFVPDQEFHGLRKISLNNSEQDSSRLSEKVCREMFDAGGVPVPRAGHALVTLNGRDLGLYVLLEGANKQFLKRYFKNAKGNLYDGGFVSDISDSLHVNSGDDRDHHPGLKSLMAALKETTQSNSLDPLKKALDVDRFVTMMALEVMMCHWDGYCLNRNNWRVFHDLDSNRMIFIPHGVDQTFGSGQHHDLSRLDRTGFQGRVANVIMRTAEGRRLFRAKAGQLYTNVFDADRISERIDAIQAGLQPALQEWNSSGARSQQRQANNFKGRITKRIGELRVQLGTPLKPIQFGSDGVLRLTGWKASTVRAGEPNLEQSKDARGKTVLGVTAAPPLSTGSWRTRLIIPEGQYRLEGLMRVQGVVIDENDTRAGAGIRISKGEMPKKLIGTSDWQKFTYEFQEPEATDVEFICELKAQQGEAWFDLESLRLVRLDR